ncbi:hypothetical protein BSK59_15680 [Paenibacillus odorifer]|uniref:hypothetical protein n=1 Tax=Paenibacillus odorifer TaxID=189426 RepID=UPI00096CE0AF|nr:hypothetical protein [Paenibacillus odorifer]OME54020.1 hypothetical protein BSK59_15680 [Paenibacillus odorifer]
MKLYQARAYLMLETFIQKMKEDGTQEINLQELQNVMSRLSSKAFSTRATSDEIAMIVSEFFSSNGQAKKEELLNKINGIIHQNSV